MTNNHYRGGFNHGSPRGRFPLSFKRRSVYSLTQLSAAFTLGGILFVFYSDSPTVAILATNIVFCLHLAAQFRSRYRFLFLIQPFTLLTISHLYIAPFLTLGDGLSYQAVVPQYLDSVDLDFHGKGILDSLGLLGFLKYTSLGVAPIFVIPDHFFGYPSDSVYYLWQGTFHVILCAIVFTLAQLWRAAPEKYLFTMALFSVISPSFFDLGAAPTRHFVTFSGILLTFLSYAALRKKITAARVAGGIAGVALVAISKAPLLMGVLAFVLVDQVVNYGARLNIKGALILAVTVFGTFLLSNTFLESILKYREIATTGAATFSGYVQLPFIGYLVKIVYALLSPFPWSKAFLFIETTYGGNWLLFIFHILSSLIGIYLYLIIILHAKRVFRYDPDLTRMILYGMIMSLSILAGSTGFHSYLLIYFPFFAPLLLVKEFRVSLMAPFWVVLPLEVLLVVFQ